MSSASPSSASPQLPSFSVLSFSSASELASVQSQEGKVRLLYINYPTDVYETMLVVNGTRCLEKSYAFFYVMKTLGFPWKLILIFTIISKSVRNWLFDRVALNRYTLLGKYNYCFLPTPDHE